MHVRGVRHWAIRRFRNLLNKRKISARFQISRSLKSPLKNRHSPGYKGQPEVLNSAHATFSRLIRMRIILDPPVLTVRYGISTEISRISRNISDFTRDFRRSVRDFGKWRTPWSCLINTLADGAECLSSYRICK